MSIRWAKMVHDLTDLPGIASAGFDAVQPTVEHLMELRDEHFTLAKENLLTNNLIPEVCSSPLPPDARVTQRGFNIYAWTEYLKRAVRRTAELGCKKLVWNDGRARVLPMEGDMSGIKEQVLQFLYMLCDIAGNYGITILVEPLGPRRTNFLNSMEEMKDFLPLVGKENLSSLISLRELSEIGIGLKDAGPYSHLISHVHLENPMKQEGRRQAPRKDDGYDYRPFLRALHDCGYQGVITLPEEADETSLGYCRTIWESLG